jgi:hypothetical protein
MNFAAKKHNNSFLYNFSFIKLPPRKWAGNFSSLYAFKGIFKIRFQIMYTFNSN